MKRYSMSCLNEARDYGISDLDAGINLDDLVCSGTDPDEPNIILWVENEENMDELNIYVETDWPVLSKYTDKK